MPDLPDRDTREAVLARALYKAWEPFVPGALKGREPNWDKFSLATAKAVRDYIEDARRVAAVILFLLFIEDSNRSARELAETLSPSTRPPILGDELVATSRGRWAEIWAQAQARGDERPTPDEFRNFVDVHFGRERAEKVAVTELTSATTDGEEEAREIIENRGLGLEAFWKSEPGACPECAPLNGKPELVWRAVYPAGPPSPHPKCRCALYYRPVSKAKS